MHPRETGVGDKLDGLLGAVGRVVRGAARVGHCRPEQQAVLQVVLAKRQKALGALGRRLSGARHEGGAQRAQVDGRRV